MKPNLSQKSIDMAMYSTRSLGLSLTIVFSRFLSALGSLFLWLGSALVGSGYEIRYRAKKSKAKAILERLENE